MIQRIQTIYLLLVSIACIAFIFIPFGGMRTAEGVVEFWSVKKVVPIMIATIVVAIVALASIFLYQNRKNQLKVVMANIVFSVVLIGLFIFGLTQHIGFNNYVFGIGAIIPVFILLFNVLAYGSIKSDENLVKSMDRLR